MKFCNSNDGDTSWVITLDIGISDKKHHATAKDSMPEFRDKADDLKSIRSNYSGFFERFTEITIILTMVLLTIFNTFYVPNDLKEY